MKFKKLCLLLTCILGISVLSGCTADELTATKNIQNVLNADYTNISGTFSKNGQTVAKYNGKTNMEDKENPYFRFIIDDRINEKTEDVILDGQSMYTSNWFFENVILKTYDPDIHEVRQLKNILEQEDFSDDTIIEFDTGIYDYLYYINTVSEDVGIGAREYLATKPQTLRKKTYVERTRNGYKVVMTGKEFLNWAEEMKETIEGNKTGIRSYLFLFNFEQPEDSIEASLFERSDNIDYVLNTYETLKPILTNTINHLGADNTITLEILNQNHTYHVIITIRGKDEYCFNSIINLAQSTGRETIDPGTETEKVSDLMERARQQRPIEPEVEPEIKEPEKPQVSALSIIWDYYDTNAQFNTATLLVNPGTKYTTTEVINFTIKNDYTYLPLRLLLEKFGETVSWDDVNKQAYVIRDKDFIPITGELIDSRTFVKIRDFEKLGYTFIYEESENVKTVKMKKK